MADVDYLFLDEDEASHETEPPKGGFSNSELKLMLLILMIWILMIIITRLYCDTIVKMTDVVANALSGRQLAALMLFVVGIIFSFAFIDYYYVYFILDVTEEPPFDIVTLGDEDNFGACD